MNTLSPIEIIPPDINWSLTRTGALMRAEARGHIFTDEWIERAWQTDSLESQCLESVTRCARCGAELLAESARLGEVTNPAIEADCPEELATRQ
jgi:hypothetical protein